MSDKKQLTDRNTNFEDLKDKVRDFQSRRGWDGQSPKDFALSLVLEAAELLEHFQFKSGKEVEQEARLYGPICDELADVLWWVLAMGNRLGIDVARAFEVKLEKNKEKYPEEIFASEMSQEEKRKKYYQIKAKYRGNHPLADKE